ncbi:MAG: extracellular solute-binding protein [Clostridia bacterium]|nr:extracellular solute-binding protein [Clostridia bacterium]
MNKFRIIVVLILLALTATLLVACASKDDTESKGRTGGEKLYVYNWYDYIDEDILDEFAEEYGDKYDVNLEIIYSKYDTNEVMLTQVDKGGASIDLVCPSEYAIEKLINLNLITNITDDALWAQAGIEKSDLWQNIDPTIGNAIDEVFGQLNVNGTEIDLTEYFIPYMWGTLGILYNTDVVKESDLDTGWGLLWNAGNNPELNGGIYMKDSIRDSYVAGVLRLKELGKLPESVKGLSVQELINSHDDELVAAVKAVLLEQKSVIKGYEVDLDKEYLINGTAYACLAWSGDAVWAIEEAYADYNRVLDYYIPNNEGNVWFDGWALLKSSQNVRASLEFMSFMNRPENAIRNSIEIGYTSAVDGNILSGDAQVIEILEENEYDSEEFFSYEVRYPSNLTNLGVMQDFGSSTDRMVAMWADVKASGNSAWEIALIIVGAVALAGVVICVIYFVKGKGKRRVKK